MKMQSANTQLVGTLRIVVRRQSYASALHTRKKTSQTIQDADGSRMFDLTKIVHSKKSQQRDHITVKVSGRVKGSGTLMKLMRNMEWLSDKLCQDHMWVIMMTQANSKASDCDALNINKNLPLALLAIN